MQKISINLNSPALARFSDSAYIRGIALEDCVERFINSFSSSQSQDNDWLSSVGEEIADMPYRTRQEAQAVAQRFNASLKGKPNIGTVATRIVKIARGKWTIKINHLDPSGKRGWRPISVYS